MSPKPEEEKQKEKKERGENPFYYLLPLWAFAKKNKGPFNLAKLIFK